MAKKDNGVQSTADETPTTEVQKIDESSLLAEIEALKAENETKDQIIADLTAELQAKEEQLKKDVDPNLLGTQVTYKGEKYETIDRSTKSVHFGGAIVKITDLTEKQCEPLIEKGFLVKA